MQAGDGLAGQTRRGWEGSRVVDDSEVGPGIDFRKFLWKFDGLGDRRFPEFPWKFGVWKGNLWGGGWRCVKFAGPTGRDDMVNRVFTAFLRYFYLPKWVATKIWTNLEEFRTLWLLLIRIFFLCDKKNLRFPRKFPEM